MVVGAAAYSHNASNRMTVGATLHEKFGIETGALKGRDAREVQALTLVVGVPGSIPGTRIV